MKALHDLGRRSPLTDTITPEDILRVMDRMRLMDQMRLQPLVNDVDGRVVQMDLERQIHHLEMAFGNRRRTDRVALRVTRAEWSALFASIRPEQYRDYFGEEGTAPPMYRGYPVLVT